MVSLTISHSYGVAAGFDGSRAGRCRHERDATVESIEVDGAAC